MSADLQRQREIGRLGAGPGEFRLPQSLHRVAGDSVLMVDVLARRWTVLVGDSIVGEYPPSHPAVLALTGMPFGFDTLGHLLMTTARGGSQDSASVELVTLVNGTRQQITMTPITPSNTRPLPTPYPAASQTRAVIAPDGAVAVVHGSPYRVDWREPEGGWKRGPALEPTPARVDAEQRKFRRFVLSRTNPQMTVVDEEMWPSVVPALGPRAIVVSPNGSLVIERIPVFPDSTQVYDVVGRSGVRVGTLRMSLGSRVVGVGSRHYFVAHPTDEGLERLERIDLPR